jgi:2',3'-cyclic-nucleotide 2'-phosphodiesterase (5'-nucleotidase family)
MFNLSYKDIALAKALHARPSSDEDVFMKHGVDIILGGHDHLYFVSNGCQKWDGYDINGTEPLGAEEDDGVLVIKSGTDFRELSELTLELEDGPLDAVRRKAVKSVVGASNSSPGAFYFISSFPFVRKETRRYPRYQILQTVGNYIVQRPVFRLIIA